MAPSAIAEHAVEEVQNKVVVPKPIERIPLPKLEAKGKARPLEDHGEIQPAFPFSKAVLLDENIARELIGRLDEQGGGPGVNAQFVQHVKLSRHGGGVVRKLLRGHRFPLLLADPPPDWRIKSARYSFVSAVILAIRRSFNSLAGL